MDGGASAIDGSGDVMLVNATLYGDGLSGMDGA